MTSFVRQRSPEWADSNSICPVIKIRGTNTINSGSTPIYVVDGLIMENNLGGFNSINMNDSPLYPY